MLGQSRSTGKRSGDVPQAVPGAPAHCQVQELENPRWGLFTAAEWQAVARQFDFSSRELDVVVLLAEGLSRAEIADRLRKSDGSRVSVQTVRVCIDRIFTKTGVGDRFELALRLALAYRQIHDAHRLTMGKGAVRPLGTSRETRGITRRRKPGR